MNLPPPRRRGQNSKMPLTKKRETPTALVLNGVRAKSVRHLREQGFDLSASVVEGDVTLNPTSAQGYPEVVIRVVKGEDYSYRMLQLNLQNGFEVRRCFGTHTRRLVGEARGGGEPGDGDEDED